MFRLIATFLFGLVGGAAIAQLYTRSQQADSDYTDTAKTQREQNLDRLMELFRDNSRVHNRDVVATLGVSPKTARNYFTELENRGLIEQRGATGRDVHYIARKESSK